jgi:hypothetical protein
MKWIRALEIKSVHLQPRCCRKIGRDEYWFTAHYDSSVDSYVQNIDGVFRNRIPVEKIEYLDEEQPSTDGWVEEIKAWVAEHYEEIKDKATEIAATAAIKIFYKEGGTREGAIERVGRIKIPLPPLPNKEG